MDNIIVGLGNPGIEYQGTRHNIGFDIIDSLAARLSFPNFQKKNDALISQKVIFERKVLLIKPQSYMNNSGIPVLNILTFYKIPTYKILVIHDEADLPFGKIKIKQGGGHAGHNGLKSLDSYIGREYWRLRFGVGRHIDPLSNLASHVLAKFTTAEKTHDAIEDVINNFEGLLKLTDN